jgi:hypothetical protein
MNLSYSGSSERNLFHFILPNFLNLLNIGFYCLVFVLVFLNPTTFNSHAQTISPKRGVAGDLLNNNDCLAVDTLTWYYNWANTPNSNVINSSQNYLEYCPMLWNGVWNATALNNYLNAHPEVKYLLTFNEPNYNVQANMTPAQAASYWPQVEAIANAHNLKIVSPAMSYCSGTCIAGYNNMHGTVWLDDFLAACPGCRIDYIAVHIYDTWYYGFKGVLDLYKKYNKQIWVTEFDYSSGSTVAQHASLMVDVLDLMEKDPSVFRYAWFLVRSSPSATSTDIFSQTTGVLADLGNIYTHMSSYDNNYYHNVNSIIEAEYYISKSVTYCNWNGSACTWPYSILLEKTTDVSGRLDAYHFASPQPNQNDTIYYNVDIPTTQSYSIDFRVNSTAASTLSVYSYPSNTLLGTTPSLNTSGAWQTIRLNGVNLSSGKQKIYLTASNGSPLKLNWLKINCTSSCGTLPVELEYFKSYWASNHSAKLEWKTSSEKDNSFFIVQRSEDGLNFDSIGNVNSSGIATGSLYYFLDKNVNSGPVYYRLKQVDHNGSFTYSSVTELQYDVASIQLNQESIKTQFDREREVYYTVTNIQGQIISQGSYLAPIGSFEKRLKEFLVNDGIYFILVVTDNYYQSNKIVVK